MKRFLLPLTVLLSCCSQIPGSAEPVEKLPFAQATTSLGIIMLFKEQGICKGDALRAEFVSVRVPNVSGCWVYRSDSVFVAFLDGDVASIPVSTLKVPKTS